MKVKVIRDFYDKHTGDYRPNGALIDVSNERFEELRKAGAFVVQVNETELEPPVEPPVEPSPADNSEPEQVNEPEAVQETVEQPEPVTKPGRKPRKKQ